MRLTYSDANGSLWSRDSALPRIRWASSSMVVPDGDERLRVLADPGLDPGTVILSAPGPEPDGAGANLEVRDDTGDRISVDVDAAGGGYLVVADWMHRGWTVTIDGEPADIVYADHALSGVFVPEGAHEVTFSYVGVGVVAGTVITALAVMVVIAVVIISVIRRRRRRAQES